MSNRYISKYIQSVLYHSATIKGNYRDLDEGNIIILTNVQPSIDWSKMALVTATAIVNIVNFISIQVQINHLYDYALNTYKWVMALCQKTG